jgi:ATP-binding protein involved in chromosome partitioning
VVENMSYFIDPKSGNKTYIFGEGGAKRFADEIGAKFLGEVPLQTNIRENADAGKVDPEAVFTNIASFIL